MRIQERLQRSVRDVHTHHFNRGALEYDPLEFEDMDDVVQTLWYRAEEALALLDEAERVVEPFRHMAAVSAFLAKLKEQDDEK